MCEYKEEARHGLGCLLGPRLLYIILGALERRTAVETDGNMSCLIIAREEFCSHYKNTNRWLTKPILIESSTESYWKK